MHFRLPLETPSLLGKGIISRFLGDAQITGVFSQMGNAVEEHGRLISGVGGGLTQVPSGAKDGGTNGNV